MKKELNTLIRLAKNEVDKIQQNLSKLLAAQDALINDRDSFEAAIEAEAQKLDGDPERGKDFSQFKAATKIKIAEMQEQIDFLEVGINKERDKLRDAFAEQKRYEIALENKIEEEKDEQKKRETKAFDELAGNNHRKKMADS